MAVRDEAYNNRGVTSEELAEWIGISKVQIRNLVRREVFQRDDSNRLPLRDTVLKYCRYMRNANQRRVNAFAEDNSEEQQADNLRVEKTNLVRAQRIMQERKNEVLEGKLLYVSDAEVVVGAVLDSVRAELLAAPTKHAVNAVGLKTLMQAKDVLSDVCNEALSRLTTTSVVLQEATDLARSRAVGGDPGEETLEEDEAPSEADGE